MSFAISRQIKLRSVEQAIFQPSYNRLNFFIQPDGLSTDLSQSYLSMRVYLTDGITNTRLTTQDMRALITANLVVSFGNGSQSYSPACMIRTARLFANKGNELLEEVNFSNVLTQSIMHQLCNDFETLEASNLLTGTSSQIGHGSSFPASLSAFINNPTEVHIPLRDLFGICHHSNFELAETDGLQITLELEDKQSLFRVTTLGDFQRIGTTDVSGNTASAVLPEEFVNPVREGYYQNVNTWAATPVAPGQFVAPSSNLFLDAQQNVMIQAPKENFWFSADRWFDAPAIDTQITSLTMKRTYTDDQLTALGIVDGAIMKLKFSITSSYVGAATLQPIEFYMAALITGITRPSSFPVITVSSPYGSFFIPTINGRTVNDVVEFLGMELISEEEYVTTTVGSSPATVASSLASNQVLFSSTNVLKLQFLGILNETLKPTGVTFDIGVQMPGGVAGTVITPDAIQNEMSSSIRKIYSNQLTKLPMQGVKSRIVDVGAPDGGGNVLITFSTLGCEAGTSIQAAQIVPTGDKTYTVVPVNETLVMIWNVENYLYGPRGTIASSAVPAVFNNLSYQIDKFELVLLQSTIQPGNRMAKPFVYSTWKVETATVETAQPTYARQFILEENVYNCMLLTPQWNSVGTDKGSLISSRRGVSHYRYSVNQVNQTNRDIYLSNFRSSYPSSLYIDRLKDTFANSDYILRSPVGIKGVADTADPVLIYPLKIYKAVSETDYTMGHPGGATVQLNLFSDTSMGEKIVPGNVWFFKQLLKQL